jgi:hypothetical protein
LRVIDTLKPIELETLMKTRVELISLIQSKLTDGHKEFLLGFKSGNSDWSLLPFEGVEELPSVKWKMINLEKMDVKKREEALEKLKITLGEC